MNYLQIVLKNIWDHISSNWEISLKALAAVWFFFAGVHVYLYAVLALTVVDVITGILASRKRGEPFTSRKLRKGLLEKMGMYLLIILTVFVLDLVLKSVFHHESFYFSFVLTFLISTYEITSIFENINTIKPNVPFLGALIRIFKKMGESTVNKLEDKVDDVVNNVVDINKQLDMKAEEKK